MEVGAPVWVRDKEGDLAWVQGTVLEKSNSSPCTIKVEVDEDFSEEPLTFTLKPDDGHELDDLKLANDESMDCVEDLIQLPHLHEAAILHSLTRRFERGDIYTFTANAILLAVNPFKQLPLYGKDLLREYYNLGCMRQQGIEPPCSLGPHVFAIADSAYRDMMKGIHAGKASGMGPINQSILISGESGAGKTESTKFVMRYLTTVGNGEEGLELEKGSIMDRVLQSNPILEAFGNARTIRNDNSSRFGKFIELMFDKRGNLLGASIETYLLEKVRLPTQSSNERNFHVFYQMCKGGDDEEKERWELEGPEEYHYVNQGDCFELRRVEDEDEFVRTKEALQTMGFDQEKVATIFDIVAGLIHMGELEFEPKSEDDDAAKVSDEDGVSETLARVCRLCYLPEAGLLRAMTSKTIEVGPRREKTTIQLKDHQAYDARDALAKALYGRLFDWLVGNINLNISCEKKNVKSSISILDIFGFECFEHNSFEQLCINYTNETLQQQFNQFVFKMEQKEYTKEGIGWSFVEFPDNQDCLDLIEGKGNGLLTMLDDECRMGIRGTDHNYALRLYKEHEKTERFGADNALKTAMCFAVVHYAGEVVYSVETFCDKNKDELPKESDELFASSSSDFIVGLFAPSGGKKKKAKGKPPAKKKEDGPSIAGPKGTVGTQFKEQLHNLMDMIRDTRPHYIRCIKPNDQAEPDEVTRVRVMEQLRYGGVLEAVRVARSGYPVRLPHKDFYGRYRCLISLSPGISGKKYPLHVRDKGAAVANSKCQELVKNVLSPAMERMKSIPADTMQFGKSKVFLRKNAHDFLEMVRSQRLTDAAITMQKMARGFVYMRVFYATRRATINIQRTARGMMGRRHATFVRRTRAATRIQTAFRRHSLRSKHLSFCSAVLSLQRVHRGRIARRLYEVMRREDGATRLQSWGRMLGPWKAYRKLKSATLALQCRCREKRARAVLKALRLKAKDLGNLKEDNDRLKAEIRALRDAALDKASAEQLEEVHSARREVESMSSEVARLKERVAELEAEVAAEVQGRERAEKEAKERAAAAEEAVATAAASTEAAVKAVEEKAAAAVKAVEEEAAAAAGAVPPSPAPAAAPAPFVAQAPAPGPSLWQAEPVVVAVADSAETEELRVKVGELQEALEQEKKEREAEAEEAKAAVLRVEEELANELTKAKERERLMSISLAQSSRSMDSAMSNPPAAEEEDGQGVADGLAREAASGAAAAAKAALEAVAEIEAVVGTSEEEVGEREGEGAGASSNGNHQKQQEQLHSDEMLIGGLMRGLDAEKEARKTVETENANLRAQVDEARSRAIAKGKELDRMKVELDEVRQTKTRFEEMATAAKEDARMANAAAAMLATDSSSRGRPVLDSNALAGRSFYSPTSTGRSAPARRTSDANGIHKRRESTGGLTLAIGVQPEEAQNRANAVLQFEERMGAIKKGLADGVDVLVWEGKTKRVEAVLTMEEPSEANGRSAYKLVFSFKGSYMIWRAPPVRPIMVDNLLEVRLGHEDQYGLGEVDDDNFLTLLAPSPVASEGESRLIVVQVTDKLQRNDLVSSLRKLLTEATLGAMAAEMRSGKQSFRRISMHDLNAGLTGSGGATSPPPSSRSVASLGGSADRRSRGSRPSSRPSSREEGGGGVGTWSASTGMSSPAKGVAGGAGAQGGLMPPPPVQLVGGDTGGGGGIPPRNTTSASLGGGDKDGRITVLEEERKEAQRTAEHLRNQLEQLALSKEEELNARKVELQEERLNYENLMVQMLEITNDINAKQDEVRMLKRKMAESEEDMAEMRRAHKDNATVSMQLLKKMESHQFDNEELRHENAMLKNQVAVFYNEARIARESIGGMVDGPGDGQLGMPSASPSGSLSSFTSAGGVATSPTDKHF